MEFTSIKNKSEIVLKGVTVEIERHDAVVRAVTLTDANGSVLKINHGDYSGLKVLVPTKPKQVEKFSVAGTVCENVKVDEVFDTEYEAKHRAECLRDQATATLTVTPVTVEEDIPF